MASASTQSKPLVRIILNKDRVCAWLEPVEGADLHELTAPLLNAELEKAKVEVTDEVVARIQAFVEQAQSGEAGSERYLLAEGRAPVPPKDGRFVWAGDLDPADGAEARESAGDLGLPSEEEEEGEDRVDYRTRNMIRTVEEGSKIGKLVPPFPGTPGLDVHGNELKPKGVVRAVQLGANVRLAEDGETVLATTAGRVIYKDRKLRIDDVLTIAGDVDYESGNVDATSDVHIRGTVRDLFEVSSKKAVIVDGAIEAARVCVAESLVVHGGILGRSKGVVEVGEELAAKFCVEANLRCRGDIRVEKEIINSKVYADGRLEVEHGSIIGGDLYARRGIVAKTLGSESAVPTELRVGASMEALCRARQIEIANKKRQEATAHIRHLVQPLLTNVKRLSAAQKERATELLFQAETMEMEIEEARSELERLLGEGCSSEDMFVQVIGQVWQRVSVAIGSRMTTVKTEMKGPLRIELRVVNNVSEFVAVDLLSGDVMKLPCRRLQVEPPAEEKEGESGGDGS